MLGTVLTVVAVLLLVVIVAGAVFLVGMRTKLPFVVNTQRRINRAVINPRAMKSAGTPGATTSIVRHTGRTSGTEYETPIVALPTDDGFLIVLPYGTASDWLKNVLASGTATIVHDGQAYQVERPELLPIDAAVAFLPASDQRNHRLFHVDQCLRLHS
jgi:deazaflavin-dependent oxidoreductase (nitroreductase family)